MTEKPWVGTWKLLSCVAHNSAGDVYYSFGENPFGRLQYDAVGNMSALLSRPDRAALSSMDRSEVSTEALRESFLGFLAYCGTYEFHEDEGYTLHKVQGSSIPNWIGGVQKRFYVLEGNRLTITTPTTQARGDEWVTVLVWEKIEALER